MSSYSPAGVQSTGMARRLLSGRCTSTPGSPAPPRAIPSARPSTRSPTPSWTPRPRRARTPWSRAGVGRATGSASRCPPARSSSSRCTRLPALAPRSCRSTCACRRRSGPPGGVVRDGGRRAAGAGRRHRPPAGDPRPRRAGGRRPHLRHERRAEAGRADLRQLAVERARLGDRARARPERALAVRAAALARRRPVDPRAQRDLRHDGDRPRALRRPSASCRAARDDGPTLVSLVPTTLAAPARRRAASDPPALRWALLGGAPDPAGAARARRGGRRPGGADLRPDRGVLAGHDARRAAVLHARGDRGRRRDPRRAARPSRRRRRAAAHRRPRRARRATATCTSPAARPTRSSPAARTSRRPRSRPCSSPPGGRRGGASTARPDPEWGEAVVATVVLRAERDATPRSCAPTPPSASPRYKVPKAIAFADAVAAHRAPASSCAASS